MLFLYGRKRTWVDNEEPILTTENKKDPHMTQLETVVASRDIERIRAFLKNWTPPAIASAIKDMSETEQSIVFRVLPQRDAARGVNSWVGPRKNAF
jgi:Mg/Co/Ni transporter MgtE